MMLSRLKLINKVKANKEKLGNFIYYSGWIGKAPLGQKLNDEVKYKKKFSYDILYKIK
jgi:hypothetical protein